MSSLDRTAQISDPLNSITISGDPNPNGIAAKTLITVDNASALATADTITLKDGYNIQVTFTFLTSSDATSSNLIGVQTAQGANDNDAAATQIAATISAGSGTFTATANGNVCTVVQDVTWGTDDGNKAVSSATPLGGPAAGITVESSFSGGREARCSLKANHKELIATGTESYIYSVREGILKARTGMGTSTTPLDFRIPEDWDLEWNYRLGPIWTPASAEAEVSVVKLWINSNRGNFLTNTGNEQQVNVIEDQSGQENDFVQTTSNQQPLQTNPVALRNNFRGLSFDGTDSLFCEDGDYGDDFDTATSEDFGVFFFIKTSSDRDDTQCLLQIQNDNTNGTFNVSLLTTSTNKSIVIHTRESSTDFNRTYENAFDHSEYHIIFVGRVAGVDTVRVDGTALTATGGSGVIKGIDGGGSDTTLGCAFGVGGGTSESNHFAGDFFEGIFAAEGSNGNILKNLYQYEGYLAWKYNIVDSLPADHAYKKEPPRANICL